MAIGQLADYARLVDPAPVKAILLPQQPRSDLCDLLRLEEITAVWPSDYHGGMWQYAP
jgi:hypothetical protein